MKIRPKVLYKIIFDIHSSSLDIFDLVGIDATLVFQEKIEITNNTAS